jgi:hypothetical protein
MAGGNGEPGQLRNGGGAPSDQRGGGMPYLGEGELRQLRNQANQVANELQGVRRQLNGAGLDQADLRSFEDAVNGLRAMGNTADPQSIQELTARALDKLQKVEYDLRRKLDTQNQDLFVAGAEEVAPQFRKPVEDYFRELSRRGGQ